MPKSVAVLLSLLCVLCVVPSKSSAQDRLFMLNNQNIRDTIPSDRMIWRLENADLVQDSNQDLPLIPAVPLHIQEGRVSHIAIDSVRHRLFRVATHTLPDRYEIISTNISGSNADLVFNALNKVRDFHYELESDSLYWVEYEDLPGEPGRVVRFDLATSQLITLATGTGLGSIAIDGERGEIYWRASGLPETPIGLFRMNFDGTEADDLSLGLSDFAANEYEFRGEIIANPTVFSSLFWNPVSEHLLISVGLDTNNAREESYQVFFKLTREGELVDKSKVIGEVFSDDISFTRIGTTTLSQETGVLYNVISQGDSGDTVSYFLRAISSAGFSIYYELLYVEKAFDRYRVYDLFAAPQTLVCETDCNLDGTVDFDDLVCGLSEFGSSVCSSDCDKNGLVEFNDLVCMLFSFGCETQGFTLIQCDGVGGAEYCSLEIPSGFDYDCNANGILDVCEIAADPSLDCDGDGRLDRCGFFADCNLNGVRDDCDIAIDPSLDCDGNGVIDDCDPDCNLNGLNDMCEIMDDPMLDLNNNGELDECEIDCNNNGLADAAEIDAGLVFDCNFNGVPDECEDDCNKNGIDDACDIADGTVQDVNNNGILDVCEIDCNGNMIPDDFDIQTGFSEDCNGNGIPDECDIAEGTALDCNFNGIPDDCDLANGFSADCNGNGIPDVCDIVDGFSNDCNENGVPDDCDLASGFSEDCNLNGIPDECDPDCNMNGFPDDCDIANGTSQDKNFDGVPDECKIEPVLLTPVDGAIVNTLTPIFTWINQVDVLTAIIVTPVGFGPVIVEVGVPISGPFTPEPGILEPGTEYFWRIALDVPGGIVNSPTWSFTTSSDAQ